MIEKVYFLPFKRTVVCTLDRTTGTAIIIKNTRSIIMFYFHKRKKHVTILVIAV